MTTLEMQVEDIASQLQSWCRELNDLAREVQIGEISEEEAADRALPIFQLVLAEASEMPSDEAMTSIIKQFRARLVPSVQRAFDPWYEKQDTPQAFWPVVWLLVGGGGGR